MPSHRTLIAIVAASAAALVGVGVALFALTRDETTAARYRRTDRVQL